MSTISKDTYRSAGKGVNCTDDMVRVTITLTQREFKRVEERLKAVLKSSESRPTVKGSSPVQQPQPESVTRTCNNCGNDPWSWYCNNCHGQSLWEAV